MKDYALPVYQEYRNWINKAREKGKTWDEINYACRNDDKGLSEFLESERDTNFWDIDVEDWHNLVELQENAEKQTRLMRMGSEQAMIVDEGDDSNFTVPMDPHSSWQLYKKKLIEKKGFKQEAVNNIEDSAISQLRRLRRDTVGRKPIKGLIIGNVQSGKTANMAALMAMAADWGWNMFIVLSGTIENLRKQTQSRMVSDLYEENCNLRWMPLEYLSKQSSVGSRAQDLHFEEGARERYFTVCLKNSARLRKLIQWLQADSNKQKQMRILVIDDEADQAGINTADISSDERTKINQLITDLVNNKTEKSKPASVEYQAMNYIGYTATPYANILNDAREESLYPRSFISTLRVSKEYFGPQQIFGVTGGDYDGLDIVRVISENDLDAIKSIQKGEVDSFPECLIDSLCWFIDGVACMRYWNYHKPVSMLIHTSQKTDYHKNLADRISNWFECTSDKEIIDHCKNVWECETKLFDKKKLREQYPDYGITDEEIRDYPDFEDIKGEIAHLLDISITHIKLDDDDDLHYTEGLHLCIDNCKNNGVDEDGMVMRLTYPTEKNMPEKAPAFIVIGGTTLSRGLTLEGLISTFFLRSVNQADTLMQMGRWFGYRKGYEMLPRIWLTQKTYDQFHFLSDLDQELRDEIYRMDITGQIPARYGPRVKNTPSYSFIHITAKNRMQSAQLTDMDYSGSFNQTYIFDENYEILHNNLNLTYNFIDGLGEPEHCKAINRHAEGTYIWRNVKLESVTKYLKDYNFNQNMHFAANIDSIIEWLEKITKEGKLSDWNIILSSKGSNKDAFLNAPFGRVNKATRTRRKKTANQGIIDIGALRAPNDIVADIDIDSIPDNEIKADITESLGKFKAEQAKAIRDIAGLSTTPQLIIYIVDKNSKARSGSETRLDLNAPEDLAGFCLNIPGGKQGTDYASTVSIHMDEYPFDDTDDMEVENAD